METPLYLPLRLLQNAWHVCCYHCCHLGQAKEPEREVPVPPRFPLFLRKKKVPVSLGSTGASAMLTAVAGNPGWLGRGTGGQLLHCGLERVSQVGLGVLVWWSPVLLAAVKGGQLQPGRCQLFTSRKQKPTLPTFISFVEEKKMKRVCVAFERNKTESSIDEQEKASD